MKKSDLLKFTILVLIIAGGLSAYFLTGLNTLSPEQLRDWILGFGGLAGLVFIVLYTVAPVLFIPGSILSLSAGTIFGPIYGTLYVLIGASFGAVLSFVTARYFGSGVKEKIANTETLNIQQLDEKIAKNGFLVVLFTRLIPIFPYTALNYAYGFSMVKARDYVLGTVLGMIPGIFAYVYLGSNIYNVGSQEFYIAIGIFAIFIGLPILFRKKIRQKLDS